ncbi:MAG: hypothetical protein AAGA38_07815 [Pseudomonadota bacterium]
MTPLFDNFFGPDRFQPDDKGASARMDASQETLANIVAVIAFGLPVVLAVGALSPAVCFHDSISAFYYSRFFGGVFVGSVSIIAALLVAYGGQGKNEWRLASVAAIPAILVAWMPTNGPKCQIDGLQLRAFVQEGAAETAEVTYSLSALAGILHVGSAILFFVFLAYFSAYVFTREVKGFHRKDGELGSAKENRNRIYLWCARVIVGSVSAIGLYWTYIKLIGEFPLWDSLRLTFVFEAIALWAFGLSWLVKGRVFGRALHD